MSPKSKEVSEYWCAFYVRKELCSLCGNFGTLDTRGVKSPAGVECGGIHFCICPNGQGKREAMLAQAGKMVETPGAKA